MVIELLDICMLQDVVRVCQWVWMLVVEVGLSLVDQIKIVIVVSELVCNILDYGGGGYVVIELLIVLWCGVCLIFVDSGFGICDIDEVLCDGFMIGLGLGLGLGGVKCLFSEFNIVFMFGQGICIMIVCWK